MRCALIGLAACVLACAPDVPSGVFKCAADDECPARMECLYDPGQSVEQHCFDYGVVLGSGADAGRADGGMLTADAAMASVVDGSAAPAADEASVVADAGGGEAGTTGTTTLSDAARYDAHLDCSEPKWDQGVKLYFGTCTLENGQGGRVVCNGLTPTPARCIDWCGGADAEAGCIN